MNTNYIGVIDLETTDKDPSFCEPVEAAVKFYDPITLEPVQNGSFQTGLMKPINVDKINLESLAISKIDIKEIEKAPSIKIVWPQFIDFINKFNPKKNKYNTPIAAGANIKNFDLPIIFRTTEQHCKKNTLSFSSFRCIDLIDILFNWFEGTNELDNYKMETVYSYLGKKNETQHRAMSDVEAEGDIIIRFMKLYRRLAQKINFKNAFSNSN